MQGDLKKKGGGGVSNQFFQGAMGNWDYYILLYVFSLLLPHAHCLLCLFFPLNGKAQYDFCLQINENL